MQHIRKFVSKRKSSIAKKPVVEEVSEDHESCSNDSKEPLSPLPSSSSDAKSSGSEESSLPSAATSLPEPFYPATLQALEANGAPEASLQPRVLPDAFKAPALPKDEVSSAIDAQDK